MEAISRESLERVGSPKGLVVFVTNDAEHFDQLVQRFVALGFSPMNKRSEIVKTGMIQIPVHMFVVVKN